MSNAVATMSSPPECTQKNSHDIAVLSFSEKLNGRTCKLNTESSEKVQIPADRRPLVFGKNPSSTFFINNWTFFCNHSSSD